MSDQSTEFLAEGMTKYKQAAATLVAFGKEVENELQQILTSRIASGLGKFVPKEAKAPRSTKYWSVYPLLNAKLDGELSEQPVTITIMINWYESEDEYPMYELEIDPAKPYSDQMREFEWQHAIELVSERKIRLRPNENDFNLKRDFDTLLDEIARFFNGFQVDPT